MARINLFDPSYGEPEIPRLSRTLTAPKCPELPLTLEALDIPGVGVASDKAEEYIGKYLAVEGQQPKLRLTVPGKRQPRLSRGLLANIATIEAMQVPDEGDEPYGLIDWLTLIVRFPGLWRQVLQLSDEVQALLETPEGNGSGAATETSSQSPSVS